jgi:hypothetical protein
MGLSVVEVPQVPVLLEEDSCYLQELLAALPKERETMDDWISVEDRLPVDEQLIKAKCKVWRFHSVDRTIETYGKWCENGKFFYDDEGYEDSGTCSLELTHWMPLPSTPEEIQEILGERGRE